MIRLWKENNKIVLTYIQEIGPDNWAFKELESEGEVTIKKTFTFSKDALYEPEEKTHEENGLIFWDEGDPEPIHFVFAELIGEYYKVKKGVLIDKFDIYIHKSLKLESNLFIAPTNISIFGVVSSLTDKDIYLGGNRQNALSEEGFRLMVSSFPNTHEKNRYVKARVASILRTYIDHIEDAEEKYHKYMNKKATKKGQDLKNLLRETELNKYELILKKLQEMLNSETAYSEKQWQEEILQILLLIYPKYIAVFREVPVKGRNMHDRFLDYMLVDSSGYTDIVEIKRPFGKSIITDTVYRNNYIPLRDLSGTIMQLEKYIYFLNRWGAEGEKHLTEKYKADLPKDLIIKITNPSGIIIMGREFNLTEDQKMDFEVIKRKYKNVVDIITYDNLLQRLKSTIEQIKKL
jgi:hypothetical protein